MANALTLHPKVTGAGLGFALTLIVVWLLTSFAHVDVPSDVETAMLAIFTLIGGYLAPASAAPAPATVSDPASAETPV